jgi:hypothetical protein
VEVRDLPVAGGSAHLRFVRRSGETAVDVLGTTGDLRVVTGSEADSTRDADLDPGVSGEGR